MAYPEQGTPMDVHDHPTHNFSDRVNLAGDVIDKKDFFEGARSAVKGMRQRGEMPNKGSPGNVIPLPNNPMGGY